MITPISLPYEYNALEPYYDEETLRIHYDKLYKGYIENLNKTEGELGISRQSKKYDNIKCMEKNLSFFGSGVILHELFFTNMISANIKTEISPELLKQINDDFGSFDNFKEQFGNSAENVEASRVVLISLGS